tara:strand:+ start:7592 stop:8260 length:669 start_codon:yes stop_codon:yes gene_type:complete
MKKIKFTLITIVVLSLIYYVSNLTGLLVINKIPTTVNSPTIEINSYIISTNLIEPKKKDFITYLHSDTIFGKQTWLHRLCAVANDTILMKNGVLYVNGENFDKNLNLVNFYTVEKGLYEEFYRDGKIIDDFMTNRLKDNKLKILLDNKTALKYDIKFDSDNGQINLFNENNEHANWTKHNFGPIIIPENEFFVLADNRDWFNDSRIIGLINRTNLLGVVINK